MTTIPDVIQKFKDNTENEKIFKRIINKIIGTITNLQVKDDYSDLFEILQSKYLVSYEIKEPNSIISTSSYMNFIYFSILYLLNNLDKIYKEKENIPIFCYTFLKKYAIIYRICF